LFGRIAREEGRQVRQGERIEFKRPGVPTIERGSRVEHLLANYTLQRTGQHQKNLCALEAQVPLSLNQRGQFRVSLHQVGKLVQHHHQPPVGSQFGDGLKGRGPRGVSVPFRCRRPGRKGTHFLRKLRQQGRPVCPAGEEENARFALGPFKKQRALAHPPPTIQHHDLGPSDPVTIIQITQFAGTVQEHGSAS
jgi:hypothetical protein